MNLELRSLLGFTTGLLLTLGSVGADVKPLDAPAFAELQRLIKPDVNETWRQIPWRISLLDAQRHAAEEGKPLFIWAMDGHPLGCT